MSRYIKNMRDINNFKGGDLTIPYVICASDIEKTKLPKTSEEWDAINNPRDFIMAFLKNLMLCNNPKNCDTIEKCARRFHQATEQQLEELARDKTPFELSFNTININRNIEETVQKYIDEQKHKHKNHKKYIIYLNIEKNLLKN